jgi:GWxTD domain-containing protein
MRSDLLSSRFALVFLFLFSLVAPVQPARAISARQLPPVYRKWLEEEVPYIISQDEKKEFLRLTTDDQRDKFMEQFWEARNPDPHSNLNIYKEEYYQRLAYVKANFGDDRYNDGWRTDMGRIYITLGPPKQIAKFHMGISTRPVEIWFYQTPSPALPPYFNLVFYQRSENETYTLYSPREDGPTRIVTNDVHDNKAALHTIDQSMGAEAVHAMVSLLPDEPINSDDPQPTMSSDLLLAAIRSLPDQKLEKDRIAHIRGAAQERVTASVFTGARTLDLETAMLRDSSGRDSVHFLLRNEQLDPQIVGKLADGKTGYNMTLRTRVTTSTGKAIYQQTDVLVGTVSEGGMKAAKAKLFAAEGRLPLVPGTYEIEATLTNELTHDGSRIRKTIRVPEMAAGGVGISDLVAYRAPSPVSDPEGQLPFAVSELRFTPRGAGEVRLRLGEKLPIMYQLWVPTNAALSKAGEAPKTLHVHYLVGSVANSAGGLQLEEDEDVEVKNLDAAGNLVTGHTLDTAKLNVGTYRLVAKVTQEGTAKAAFATMTIKVLPTDDTADLWTAFGDERQHPVWQDDLLRGIAAETLGKPAEAEACYRRALAINSGAGEAQIRLNALVNKTTTLPPQGQ